MSQSWARFKQKVTQWVGLFVCQSVCLSVSYENVIEETNVLISSSELEASWLLLLLSRSLFFFSYSMFFFSFFKKCFSFLLPRTSGWQSGWLKYMQWTHFRFSTTINKGPENESIPSRSCRSISCRGISSLHRFCYVPGINQFKK